jgi:multidrug efflux pump subunit AcrB
MRGLITFSLRNPVLTVFLTIFEAIAGAVAYYTISQYKLSF